MRQVVHKHSAGGVLIDEDKVLVIHWDKPRDSYDFPKGSVEPGESLEATCIREVEEETGYRTSIVAPIGQTHYEYDWIDGTHHKKTVDYFLLEKNSDQISVPAREDHERFTEKWIDVEEAKTLLTREIDRDLLHKALILKSQQTIA